MNKSYSSFIPMQGLYQLIFFRNAKDETTTAQNPMKRKKQLRPVAVLQSNGMSLHWRTSILQSSCSEETGYDQVILAPHMEKESMHGNQ